MGERRRAAKSIEKQMLPEVLLPVGVGTGFLGIISPCRIGPEFASYTANCSSSVRYEMRSREECGVRRLPASLLPVRPLGVPHQKGDGVSAVRSALAMGEVVQRAGRLFYCMRFSVRKSDFELWLPGRVGNFSQNYLRSSRQLW